MKSQNILIGVIAIAAISIFGKDPYKHVGNVEGLGNFHQKLSADKPYALGEELTYSMHYGFVKAAEAKLKVNKRKVDIDGTEAFHVVGTGNSVGAFDWMFKVRDVYETFIDEVGNPVKFKRRVDEGGHKISRDYKFDHDQDLIHNGRDKAPQKMPDNVQDMISSFYYARNIDMSGIKKGDILTIYSYVDFEVYPLQIKFKGFERKEVDAGTFDCMKFVPVVQQGRVFKDEEDLTVWITNDANRIPVLAKADILFGSIQMELINTKGVKHTLAQK